WPAGRSGMRGSLQSTVGTWPWSLAALVRAVRRTMKTALAMGPIPPNTPRKRSANSLSDMVAALAVRCDKDRGSVLQDLGQEMLRALGTRRHIAEELFIAAVFDDFAGVHEHHAIGHLAGESHFVGDHHHGHGFAGQVHHDVEHFVDHF